jgi:Peptidase M50B-like
MKQSLYLIALIVLIYFLWPYQLLYPLKLLVVFFHEASHALAAVATGGSVQELVIVKAEGGHVVSRGGNRFLILSAGYLGSLLCGVFIYFFCVNSRLDRIVMWILGLFVIVVTVIYGRGLFSWSFGLGSGCAMLASAYFLNRKINDFLLRVIALTNMLYVPLDIYSDTIQRSGLQSDAARLAEEFGGTTLLWGSAWLLVSLVIIVFTVWGVKPRIRS